MKLLRDLPMSGSDLAKPLAAPPAIPPSKLPMNSPMPRPSWLRAFMPPSMNSSYLFPSSDSKAERSQASAANNPSAATIIMAITPIAFSATPKSTSGILEITKTAPTSDSSNIASEPTVSILASTSNASRPQSIAARAATTPVIIPAAANALPFTFLLLERIATQADKSVSITTRHAVISIAVSGLPQLESMPIMVASTAATPAITPIAAIDLPDTEPILPMIFMHTAKSVSNRIMHAVDLNAASASIVDSKYTHPASTAIVTASAITVPLFLLITLAFARTIAKPIIIASSAATPLAS